MSVLISIAIWLASLGGVTIAPAADGIIVEYVTLPAPGVQCFRHVWISTVGEGPAFADICTPR